MTIFLVNFGWTAYYRQRETTHSRLTGTNKLVMTVPLSATVHFL
uniref:Uncharacterized protein n=1 Tax=Anguilla anguilla TaxID=7936 RepID=A0A0E9QHT5_ANGAN